MAIAYASWVHGHAGRIEHPDRLSRITRVGWALEITGRAGQDTWIHYSIPTPVIVQDQRLRADAVFVRYRVPTPDDSAIWDVHVFDGEQNLIRHERARLLAPEWNVARIDLPHNPAPHWGIGVSLGVRFSTRAARGDAPVSFRIDIASVGCDFAPAS